MALQCPECGATILAENINMQKTLALCSQCNRVFDFGNMRLTARKAKPRPRPERLHILQDDYRVEMSYQRVFGPGAKFGMAAIGFAAVFISLMTVFAALNGAPALFALFIGLIACVFWYILAVPLINTTRLTFDDDALEVHSGPLPFPTLNSSLLSTRDIKRIFVEDTVEGGSGMPAHNVVADLFDGNRLRLLSSLPRNYAVYIAEALDAFLQADDESAAAPTDALVEDEAAEVNGLDDLAVQAEPPTRRARLG